MLAAGKREKERGEKNVLILSQVSIRRKPQGRKNGLRPRELSRQTCISISRYFFSIMKRCSGYWITQVPEPFFALAQIWKNRKRWLYNPGGEGSIMTIENIKTWVIVNEEVRKRNEMAQVSISDCTQNAFGPSFINESFSERESKEPV